MHFANVPEKKAGRITKNKEILVLDRRFDVAGLHFSRRKDGILRG